MDSPSLVAVACLTLFLICITSVPVQAGRVGFCYGRVADNLPPPSQVARLLLNQSVNLVRIFNYDVTVIQAFANTNIEMVISVPNEELQNFQTEKQAVQWVGAAILPFYPATNITAVTVGGEVVTSNPEAAPLVLPAMQNIHTALTKAGLASQIRVTTTHSMAVVQNSFPPSSSVFNASFADSFIHPLLDFIQAVGSYFMVNAYPYIAYNQEPESVALDYALFEPQQLVTDNNTNLQYHSMFDAQVDAIYFAMEAMGHKEINIVVSETGWPTASDNSEQGADVQNAATYNNNLALRVLNNSGTPHKPGQAIDVFIFSIFDEDKKPGPLSERNWGVYEPDGTRKYYLDLQGTGHGAAPQSFNGTRETWCVARPDASNDSLAEGLDWACGQGNADCDPIQQGQSCYEPNTFINHASYAYNSYYQKSGDNSAACNFSGTAVITSTDPSYGSCMFPADSLPPFGGVGNQSSLACDILPFSSFKIIAISLLLSAF